MNLRNVGIIFRKELRDTLRDRRTLISTVIVPLLLYPLLIFGFGGIAYLLIQKMKSETHPIMLLHAENAPEIARRLKYNNDFEVVPAAGDYVQRINEKKLRVAVEFPEQMEEKIRANPDEPQSVRLYWYEDDDRSRTAVRAVEKVITTYRNEVVKARVESQKLPANIAKPFSFEQQNVAPPEKVTGNILGMILPYMAILLCLTGGMYPAMDMTAGEKERGTMETLLTSPANRVEIVVGKFLMVMVAAMVTAALSIASFALTFLAGAGFIGRMSKGFVVAVSGKSIAAVFLVVLPLAIVFAGGLLAISVIARSYREAQTYIGPLIFLVILPAVAGMTPGMELTPKMALIPILNISLVCKEIFSGHYPWQMIGIIFGSTCVYAAAALWFAVRQFHKEQVIFRV